MPDRTTRCSRPPLPCFDVLPRRAGSRYALALTATALVAATVLATLLTPASALATRVGSDTVGGRPLSSGEITQTLAPDVAFQSGLLLTADGRELWGRRPSSERPMASITKVMTALLALENGGLDDVVTISKTAAAVDDGVGLVAGETFTVRELLELALIASSNDAAIALAEHVGGTVPQFITQMNDKAAQLNLDDTHYVNPHGLDSPGHHSSAEDIAVLAAVAMKSGEFRRIVALRSVTLPAYEKRKAEKLKATNELLATYRGMLGVKTGFTNDAGHSLVGSAERNGITLTAVVLGGASNASRFTECAKLLDWGFKHYAPRQVACATETVGSVSIAANPTKSVSVRFAETTTMPVFDLAGPVTNDLTLPKTVALPLFAGQRLGEVVVTQDDTTLARIPAVAASSIASAEETVGAVPVAEYLDRAVTARAADASLTVAEFDPARPVDRLVDLDAKVHAPIAVGDQVGEIVYSQGGKEIVRVPVVAVSAVSEPGLGAKVSTWFARGWRMLTGQPTMAARVVL